MSERGIEETVETLFGVPIALPHNLLPASVYHDPLLRKTYGTDASGNYHVWDNGWWRPLHQRPAGT